MDCLCLVSVILESPSHLLSFLQKLQISGLLPVHRTEMLLTFNFIAVYSWVPDPQSKSPLDVDSNLIIIQISLLSLCRPRLTSFHLHHHRVLNIDHCLFLIIANSVIQMASTTINSSRNSSNYTNSSSRNNTIRAINSSNSSSNSSRSIKEVEKTVFVDSDLNS